MYEDAGIKKPKMTSKQAAIKELARYNYEFLCNVGTFLDLSCVMPLLESVTSLMKFAQSNYIFVSDYIASIIICQGKLYMMYDDPDFVVSPLCSTV